MSKRVEWLTIEQVAARWQCCRRTVLRMIERGQLPAVKLGRLWRVLMRDVVAYETGAMVGTPVGDAIRREVERKRRTAPQGAARRIFTEVVRHPAGVRATREVHSEPAARS